MHIAVVIPVYNAARYIGECLDSITGQTFGDWEAVCVDDGSTDGTADLLASYAKKDSRIKVLTKANGGAASARNMALDAIAADDDTWIAFVDADDYLAPTFFAGICSELSKPANRNCDYVRIEPLCVDKRGQNAPTDVHPLPDRLVDVEEYFASGQVLGYMGSLFVKSTLIKRYNRRLPADMTLFEDEVFVFQCAVTANKILIHNHPGYYYFQRPDSVSATLKRNNTDDVIKCINRVYDILSATESRSTALYLHQKHLPRKFDILLTQLLRHRTHNHEKLNRAISVHRHIKGIKPLIKYICVKAMRLM